MKEAAAEEVKVEGPPDPKASAKKKAQEWMTGLPGCLGPLDSRLLNVKISSTVEHNMRQVFHRLAA